MIIITITIIIFIINIIIIIIIIVIILFCFGAELEVRSQVSRQNLDTPDLTSVKPIGKCRWTSIAQFQ